MTTREVLLRLLKQLSEKVRDTPDEELDSRLVNLDQELVSSAVMDDGTRIYAVLTQHNYRAKLLDAGVKL